MKLHGVIVAVHTPLTETAEVHEEALRRHVDYLIEAGVHALFPLGTMGEGIFLSEAQRKRAAEIVVDQAKGRVPVVVQATSHCTAATIDLCRHAREAGARGVAVIAPYYYPMDEPSLEKFYKDIAGAVPGFPVYLYNNPGRASNAISSGLAARLHAGCPNIVGIKDSSKDLILFQEYIELGGPDFTVVVGTDGLVFPAMMVGGAGAVSAVANAFPELMVALYDAIVGKEYAKARRLQFLVNKLRIVLKVGPYLAGYKEILRLRGRDFPTMMVPPLRELNDEERARIRAAFAQLPPEVFTGTVAG
ncbi:MAG: dihydrodipicolinate synthase family protein [Bacillota bacterium]|nr:dihydrodipicolinate synthase family protein [Bacillota bacterium]